MDFSSTGPSSFANSGASNGAQVQIGQNLNEISTEALGFQSIAGDTKLRLFSSPWPTDNLPPSTASLLSVASRNGLLAAAGPDSVIIASTEAVRNAYTSTDSSDTNEKPFSPQLTLNIGTRISQVSFSADEDFLVLSAEQGGGIAVYETKNILDGNTQSSFELSTNGSSLRALVPNPALDLAEYVCLVTTKGELLMANLKTRQLLSGPQGPVLKQGISCASWSPKGKQLVAGQGDGTCVQITPDGEGKGDFPRPPNVDGEQHVSSILWLETYLFIAAYTPSSHEPGMPPMTTYNLITRAKGPQAGFTFQKLPEPCPPFGMDRNSPYQFMERLKDFPPNLSDVIIVASTASTDVGLVTRSKSPLTTNLPSEQITNIFTTTSMADDSRRAQLPMAVVPMEGLPDTSPVGIALDLSSKQKVGRPLPKEEFDESPGPLPALMILNNEGILTTWWLVYAESIRQGTTYPGLVAVAGNQPTQPTPANPTPSSFAASPSAPSQTQFGQTAFGQPTSTFGSVSNRPSGSTFGSPSTNTNAFGSSSALGNRSSPWATQGTKTSATSTNGPSFGQSAFGSQTPIAGQVQGTAFGVSGGLANRASPWATPSGGGGTNPGAVFGQSSGLGSRASPFGAPTASTASSMPQTGSNSGGFASFAAAKPSAFTATSDASSPSIFGKPSTGSTFGSSVPQTSTKSSLFDPQPSKNEATKSAFGSGAFTLGSTFKSDGTANNDLPKPSMAAGTSMFGSNFGASLGQSQATAPASKDADMEDDEEPQADNKRAQDSSTSRKPPQEEDKAAPSLQTAPPVTGGLFGTQSQGDETPAKMQLSKPAGMFANTPFGSTTPKEDPKIINEDLPAQPSPKVKTEPAPSDDGISPLNEDESQPPEGFPGGTEDQGTTNREPKSPVTERAASPEAPLPPESTSKTTFAPGDSSNSSKSSAEEAPATEPPLPPDPSPAKSKLNVVENAGASESPAPASPALTASTARSADQHESSEGSKADLDDEGSGVDVGQEISSPSATNRSPKISPESSFGTPKSPIGGLFSNAQIKQEGDRQKPLFGEVGRSSVPVFPQPSKTQQSPRSPSPVRQTSHLVADSLRPDNSRSVSAPGPFKAIVNRKLATNQLVVAPRENHPLPDEQRKQEEQRILAERAKRIAEEEQDLSDDEDEQIRQELLAPVEPSLTLDPFLAHQDYVGKIDKPGIPGQIEKVYRDINSMIDTLGLNARSLAAFVKGHSDSSDDGDHDEDYPELDEADDWCLGDLRKLKDVENELAEDLHTHRFENVQHLISGCRDIRSDSATLRHRRADLTRAIENRLTDQSDAKLLAPLSLEQMSQQQGLRKHFLHFQKLLATAEEELTVLRAKLASCDSTSSFSSKDQYPQAMRKPTVEAVTKTILKMTSMVEKKSGDIDVLELQLRNLGLLDQRPTSSQSYRGSREGSPLSSSIHALTGTNSRTSPSSMAKGTKGRLQKHARNSPGHSPRNSPLRHSAAPNSSKSPLRNSINSFTTATTEEGDEEEHETEEYQDDEIQLLKEKMQRRKVINQTIREVFEKQGPRIRALDD